MDGTLERLYSVVLSRKADPQEGSYTCYLFDKGLDKILKKVMMAEQGIPLEDVLAELDRRARKIGNLKQMKQVDKES